MNPAFLQKHTSLKPFTVHLALGAVVLVLAIIVSGCSPGDQAKQEQLYTCGMHPQVIQNKPGNCPICGMKLTPIRKQAGHSDTASAAKTRTEPTWLAPTRTLRSLQLMARPFKRWISEQAW